MKRAKVQKTKGIVEYWNYYCNLKKNEGWIKNEHCVVIKQFIKKDNNIITYEQFSELVKSYYKEAGIYIIRGYRLRFDYGLGNLRVIRYEGREPNLKYYKNMENVKITPACTFYFHRDAIDCSKRKRELGTMIENFNDYDLHIARSDGSNDKSLGLKFKLSKMIKNNPDLIYSYDARKFEDTI